MATSYPRWHVQAVYSSGCFCDRPGLPKDARSYSTGKRMEWRKAASDYAAQAGLVELEFSPKDKVASAILPIACTHRAGQIVRLDVDYLR